MVRFSFVRGRLLAHGTLQVAYNPADDPRD